MLKKSFIAGCSKTTVARRKKSSRPKRIWHTQGFELFEATQPAGIFQQPDTVQKALNIATWLKEKKAEDISILDLSGTSPVADVMIILTAQGARHAQALADWLLEKLAESGMACLGMEGYREGRWILVDCNDVLAHIFQEDSRRFYNLDGLWSQSSPLFSGGLPGGLPATGITATLAAPLDKA